MPTGTSGSVLVVIVGPPVPCRDYDRRYHLRPGTVIQAYRKLTLWPPPATTRQPRGERGLSQERLAEMAGIHMTYPGGIETARRNPSFINLLRLARALGVSLSQLFETVR